MPISRVGVKQTTSMARLIKGFSLLEVLLATMILGLLVAVVTPTFTSTYHNIVLKSTVRSAASTLRYVRASAIGAREVRTLKFDLDNKLYLVEPSTAKLSQSQSIAEFIECYDPEVLWPVDEEKTQPVSFRFSPSGGSTGGSLVFAYRDLAYLLDVSPLTGKVKVSRQQEVLNRQKTADVNL